MEHTCEELGGKRSNPGHRLSSYVLQAPLQMPRWVSRLRERAGRLPVAFLVHTSDGTYKIGAGEPAFAFSARNGRGVRALGSLDELAICEAYMRGDLDLEGDAVQAMVFREALSDPHPWIYAWRWLKPLLVGRVRCNPAWIAQHYDAANIQLVAADEVYNTYTPGLYTGEADTLEAGAERKLAFAFDSLRLDPGDRVLDVGCGWGGFLRYCACRGIVGTGITLSRDQFEYARRRLADDHAGATVLHQDFFTFEPERPFDGISIMGVMEDLSDYRLVLDRLATLAKPGGRIYCDFAASLTPVSSFITRHIWPGAFRLVHFPELVASLSRSPFEIVALQNDRRNYYLWASNVYRRWLDRKAEVIARANEATWRMFHLLYAGGTRLMSEPTHSATAYRLVLELPADAVDRAGA